MSWWSRIASVNCDPTLCTGFSEVIGSWKIIAISSPRIARSFFGLIPIRFSSFQSASPLEIVVLRLFRPMIVRQVTLLPQPDSPTIPSVLPFSTEKLTPSTALTMPSSVRKYVFRSLTSRSGIARFRPGLCQPDAWVDHRVEQVDDQVEDDDDDGREDDHAHDRRHVVVVQRLHRRPTEAWEAVHGL